MKKQVEKFIPAALQAVRDVLAQPDIDGRKTIVFEEYDGYAASFGASVVTAGLLPTVSFYTNVHKKEKKEEDEVKKPRRYKMLKALAAILRDNGFTQLTNDETALLDFINTETNRADRALKADIVAASIALKLALRNFQHIKSGSDS